MGRFISNLVLIFITGCVFIWSYYNLRTSVEKSRAKEAQHYLNENQAIDDLQAKYPKSLTMNEVNNYDKQHGTRLSLKINTDSIQMSYHRLVNYHSPSAERPNNQNLMSAALESIKTENAYSAREATANEDDLGFNIPPLPALIFGGIGIFLGTLITNLGNTCYKILPNFFKKNWLATTIILLVFGVVIFVFKAAIIL